MCNDEDPAKTKKTRTRRHTQDQIKMDLLIRADRGETSAIIEYLKRYGKDRGYGDDSSAPDEDALW